jgi:acetyl esterase
MQWFWDQYLQGYSHDQNPYAIPARAESFKDVAPAIILTAQYDPLLSDGEQYAELLKGHDVDVRYREFQGMIHGFFTNLAVTPTATVAIEFVAEQIKEITQ